MTNEHINSLANHLEEQKELFYTHNYTHVSVLLTKEEINHILNHLHDHKEPTYEEVMDYCKARHLYLITYSAFENLASGNSRITPIPNERRTNEQTDNKDNNE